jgi:hypothetical protein
VNRTAALALCLAAAGCASAGRASPSRVPRPETHLDSLALAGLDFAAQQYRRAAQIHDPAKGYPRATDSTGAWNTVRINDWTSGFFPGTLWYLYEHTRDADLKAQAERWTLPLADIPKGRYTHDLGFQFFSSFGNAYRITGEERFRAPILNASRLLAARFSPTVGAIKSWDRPDRWAYPVIVDNMMNLEMLLWAAEHGGNPAWEQLAIRHAETTLKNHLRPDGGSFHVVDFDTIIGAVRERVTHQGYADASTWARGQAWLTYGFTMAYRETGDPRFLNIARRVADYALARLPTDYVPCWDYQAPGCPDTAKRDVSAAAIMASGLLELSTYVSGAEGARYRQVAENILASLASSAYLARGSRMPSVLLHAVGNYPAGSEIDVGINYADYYFVEALLRYLELRGLKSPGVLPARAPVPRVFSRRAELLAETKARIGRDDPGLRPAYSQLLTDAADALQLAPVSVLDKKRVPPSGDKHDYMSFGPYWWPDPSKPKGLPYIRRDGERNPEAYNETDTRRLDQLVTSVEALGLAYHFTEDEKYANHAARLLRVWFLEPDTRMNPNLTYAQAIPGRTEGRGIGIIETRRLTAVIDALGLLERSNAWTAADCEGIRSWMDAYLEWLLTSPNGLDEKAWYNNHGTWYDAQAAAMALFLGKQDLAREILSGTARMRLNAQITKDGQQPEELARTRSLSYSAMNLEGFSQLAEMGRHVGLDLWHYEGMKGGSIRKALSYLAPYANPARKWEGEQITEVEPDALLLHLLRARRVYGDPKYEEWIDQIPSHVARAHRARLLYPEPVGRS